MDSLDLCNSIRMEFEGVIENKIPLDVFPAKLQDMVLALARQENYSIEYTMASLIAAASTAIGNAVNIRIRGGWVSRSHQAIQDRYGKLQFYIGKSKMQERRKTAIATQADIEADYHF